MDRRKASAAVARAAENGDVAADAMASSSPALALRKKVKKRLSSGSAAQRDESEFVSVEVGMREFQRRLASSKSTADGKKKAATTTIASSESAVSRSRSRSDQQRVTTDSALALPPAEDQPKKRARTTKAVPAGQPAANTAIPKQSTAAAAAASTTPTPRARKAAAAVVTSTSAAAPPVQQDPFSGASTPVKPPARKRAAAAAAKYMPPATKATAPTKAKPRAAATTTTAARKPRAAPVARRQTTIAEIRAQLLHEQQERVEARIQTLHCANCNSVTHAGGHVHTAPAPPASAAPPVVSAPAPAPGLISHYFQQQQQQQQQQQPQSQVAPLLPPPPPMFHAQYTGYPQASAVSSNNSLVYTEVPPTLEIPQTAAAAAATQSHQQSAAPPPVSIKNEFIEDDFDEDMAFMMALDQVEQSLTTPTKAPAPFPPSMVYHQNGQQQQLHQPFASVPQLFQQNQATATGQIGGIDGAGMHRQHQSMEGTQGGSSHFVPDGKPSREDLSQPQVPAMPAEMQREFERLKRENELLRQSNELLQAAATSSSGGSVATTTTAASSSASSSSPLPPQIHHQTQHLHPPAPLVRSTEETMPSSSPSSDQVPATDSEARRVLSTNHPVAVQAPQHQSVAKRFLNLGNGGSIKQEEEIVDPNKDNSREGPHHFESASVNENVSGDVRQNQSDSRLQASYGSTVSPPAEKSDNLHSSQHADLPPGAEVAGSPARGHSFASNEQVQSTKGDGNDPEYPGDPQTTAERDREEDSDIMEDRAAEEEEEGRANAQLSDAAEKDQHENDDVGASQSAGESNGLSQSGDFSAPNDDDDEDDASQEEVARASTIDRGNYQQYKAQYDEDDEDAAMEDVEVDVDETTCASRGGKSSEHVADAASPNLAALPSRVDQVGVGENAAAEADRPSALSREYLAALEARSNRSSTELSAADPTSSTNYGHHGEGVSGKHTEHDETQGVTEADVTMQETEDEANLSEESKSKIAAGVDFEDEVGVQEPKAKARLWVQEVSSSDSETESDDDGNRGDDDNDVDGGIPNGLEAALKAAAGGSGSSLAARGSSPPANSKSQQRGSFSLGATGSVSDQPKLGRESNNNTSSSQAKKKRARASDDRSAGDSVIAAAPEKKIARSKHQLGSGTSSGNSSSNSSVKSTLLWPALDEFYEFILDLSPRRIEVPERHQSNLRHYFRGMLPAKYSSLSDYTSVQIEAIMEELAASVRSSEQFSHQNSSKSLFLTSVSPCGRAFSGGGQQSSSLPSGQQLNSSTIFIESGFSGTTSGSNDFILTFHANVPGRGGSSADFTSGDLVLVRSPRWKQYEMVVYGVVLCNSMVAIGGSSGSGGGGGRGGQDQDNDLICVLIRTQERDHANPKEDFSVLTEMCLANQHSSNWKWRLEQVHNLTTSAREFQAMKSVGFFSPSIKRSLLDGKMSASESQREKSGSGKTSAAASDGGGGTSEPKSRLTPALHRELEKKYNSSQLDAILGCIGEENHVIIQGPPGTGKTKTILGVLSALLDGAAVGGAKRSKESTRVRVGASLKDGNASSGPRTVAQSSIRILVAAPSNAAVDELIVRLLSEGVYDGVKCCSYRPRIVRVGRPESLQQQREPSESSRGESEGRLQTDSKKIKKKKWRKYAQEVEEILLENLVTKHKSSFPNAKTARQAIVKNAQVVFCTLSGAGSVAMCDFAHEFDALVIDEAAQAVEASSLIPFKFRPNRVILVGDHQQLPATVISKRLIDMGYDRSLFQRFVENGSQVFLLNRQYRMHPDISEFPSRYFYKGKLVQDAKMSDWTARKYHADKLFQPFVFYDVLSGQQSQVSGSKSLRNLTEVEFILLLVRGLLKKYPEMNWKKKIGIIAPYKQQIYELGSHLSRLEKDVDQRLDVEVNTVDGFQGREKEIIIYSCVRTSGGGKRRRNGNNSQGKLDAFWADERRMNVAITRAKSSLWIVGNSQLLEQSRAWRALIRTAKDRDKYMRNTDVEF